MQCEKNLFKIVADGVVNAIAEAGPVVIGLLGLFLGWLVWQLANEPGPVYASDRFSNFVSGAAFLSGLSGWGVAFSLATWIRGRVDKREKQRYEQQIADLREEQRELERKRDEDNRWWREHTSKLEETRRVEREKHHRELISSFNSLRDAILASTGQARPSAPDDGTVPDAPSA